MPRGSGFLSHRPARHTFTGIVVAAAIVTAMPYNGARNAGVTWGTVSDSCGVEVRGVPGFFCDFGSRHVVLPSAPITTFSPLHERVYPLPVGTY